MKVTELLSNRMYLKIAIEDLICFLKEARTVDTAQIDGVMTVLLRYIDDHQKYLIMIGKSNIKTTIKVGNSKVSISDAIKIRDGIKNKIDVLTILIEIRNEYLDVLDLMGQRKKFYASGRV